MPKIIEAVEESILSTAKTILLNSSYKDFNIRNVAKCANIAVGTIYNYYPSKDALVRAIFFSDWNNALERMSPINDYSPNLRDKLFNVYLEMDLFLRDYLKVFLEISSSSGKGHNYSCMSSLIPIVNEIVLFERASGNITSPLSNDVLCKFIINNLMMVCTDESLSFDEIYSLMKL